MIVKCYHAYGYSIIFVIIKSLTKSLYILRGGAGIKLGDADTSPTYL